MRVLMSADAVGGVWTYALDLARAFARQGHATELAVLGPPPAPAQRAEALAIPDVRLHVLGGKLEWMEDPWPDVASQGRRLLDLAHRVSPDVVHLNGYCHGALPWPAPVLMVAHSCVASWWEAVHRVPPPPAWDRYRDEVRRGLQGAGLVVAPTRAMLDETRRLHGPFPAPGLVIHNGRDEGTLAPLPKRPFALCVGRVWDEGKDVATLDAAAEGLPWPVHVAGDPRRPWDGRAASLRHARLLGHVPQEELRRALGEASVLVHPARYEPFGLAPLEGALAGCALVLSDIPSLREVWGDAALYARPGDAPAFREALRQLAQEPKLRESMALAARRRAARYTTARMADAYLDAYARLMGDMPFDGPEEDPPCAS